LDPLATYSVPLEQKASSVVNLGEYLEVYFAGHSKDGAVLKPFTKNILSTTDSNLFDDVLVRGRLDVHPKDISHGDYVAGDYPDVPAGAMLSEFFCFIPPDNTRIDEAPPLKYSRIYGRININTAPKAVLARLPFDLTVTIPGLTDPTLTASDAADYIIAYRDKNDIGSMLYKTTGRNVSGVTNLSNAHGFMAAGEVGVPLVDYVNQAYLVANPTKTIDNLERIGEYINARNKLYRSISNLITVNSDVYAVYIYVKANEEGAAGTADAKSGCEWRYIAVVDRSNCRDADDTPAVLLFSELK